MYAAAIVDGRLKWRGGLPDPVPGRGEVLIRVHQALNAADLLQRAGRYPTKNITQSDVPGLEVSGEVATVGPEVQNFVPGNRVMALVTGAHAELALADEGCTVHVPDELSWAESAGLPEAFTTAHDALFTQCGLAPGERLCVHGGAGGVGVAAIQLGVAISCDVIATVARSSAVCRRRRTRRETGRTRVFRGPSSVRRHPRARRCTDPRRPHHDRDRRTHLDHRCRRRITHRFRLPTANDRGRIHGSTLRSRPPEERASAVSLLPASRRPAGRIRTRSCADPRDLSPLGRPGGVRRLRGRREVRQDHPHGGLIRAPANHLVVSRVDECRPSAPRRAVA